MVGEALLTLEVGKKSIRCPVWATTLEDCIVGLDVLGGIGICHKERNFYFSRWTCRSHVSATVPARLSRDPHHCSAGS